MHCTRATKLRGSSPFPLLFTSAITILLAAAAPESPAQATTYWTRPPEGVWYWGNPSNWSDGVPGPGIHAVIPIDFARAYVDVTAFARDLTIEKRAQIDSVSGSDLTVLGTTTITQPIAPGASYGGEIRARSGSVFSLGTLANFSNGVLTGTYEASDHDSQESRDATIIQFRGANVITNNAEVYITGIDAAIRDQDTGLNAFRNLGVNNRRLTLYEIPGMQISGGLTNNGRMDFWDYSANYEPAAINMQVTINGPLRNNQSGYFELTSAAQVTINGDVQNWGRSPSGGILSVWGDSWEAPDTARLRVKGNLRNELGALVEVLGELPAFAHLIVEGSMINSGHVYTEGTGIIHVGRGLILKNGGSWTVVRPVETYQMTATRIDIANGSQFGARGTVFADLSTYGIFRVGASVGQRIATRASPNGGELIDAPAAAAQATVNGDLVFADPSTFEVEIGGAPGSNLNDHLTQVSGEDDTGTRLGGTLAIYVINDYETSISPGDVFTVLTSDKPLTGAFNNVANGERVNTFDSKGSFQVNYNANTVTLTGFDATIPPGIIDFSPSGVPNQPITIFGVAFMGTTSVQFNGLAAASFTVDSDTQITAVVPAGATDGPITVTTPEGSDTSNDNFDVLADEDSDGMSDVFEMHYPTANDPAVDSDGDGTSNLAEYRAGTDPANAVSAFRIKEIRRDGSDIVLTFASSARKRYRIEAKHEFVDAFTPVITNIPPDIVSEREVRHTGGAAQTSQFYRAIVLP